MHDIRFPAEFSYRTRDANLTINAVKFSQNKESISLSSAFSQTGGKHTNKIHHFLRGILCDSHPFKNGHVGVQGYVPGTSTDFIPCLSTLSPETLFMYLRAIFCTFQISVDFYYVPLGGEEGGEGGLEKGRGLERGG